MTKNNLEKVISNLKTMAYELEELYNEMDELSENDFESKSEIIQDKYSEEGIKLVF